MSEGVYALLPRCHLRRAGSVALGQILRKPSKFCRDEQRRTHREADQISTRELMGTAITAHPVIQLRSTGGGHRQPYEISAPGIRVRNILTFARARRDSFFDGSARPFHRVGLIVAKRRHFRKGRARHQERPIVVWFEVDAIGERRRRLEFTANYFTIAH